MYLLPICLPSSNCSIEVLMFACYIVVQHLRWYFFFFFFCSSTSFLFTYLQQRRKHIARDYYYFLILSVLCITLHTLHFFRLLSDFVWFYFDSRVNVHSFIQILCIFYVVTYWIDYTISLRYIVSSVCNVSSHYLVLQVILFYFYD